MLLLPTISQENTEFIKQPVPNSVVAPGFFTLNGFWISSGSKTFTIVSGCCTSIGKLGITIFLSGSPFLDWWTAARSSGALTTAFSWVWTAARRHRANSRTVAMYLEASECSRISAQAWKKNRYLSHHKLTVSRIPFMNCNRKRYL